MGRSLCLSERSSRRNPRPNDDGEEEDGWWHRGWGREIRPIEFFPIRQGKINSFFSINFSLLTISEQAQTEPNPSSSSLMSDRGFRRSQ